MADNFFDGTLDDFFDDPALLDLARLALPLDSPSPPRVARVGPARPDPLVPQTAPDARFRRGSGDGPTPFGGVREGSALPSDVLGPGLVPGPTRPASNRPTPAASRRAELSRLNAARRTLENPRPRLSQLRNSPSRRAPTGTRPTISATSSPSRSAFSSTLAATSNPQRSHGDISPSARPSRDLPRISTQHRSPHQPPPSDIAGPGRFAAAIERATQVYNNNNNLRSPRLPTMSSNTRRRSVRPTDLTMPSSSSQAAPSSRPVRATRRSTSSQPVQPAPSSSMNKRKREPDLDDLFGDGPFADQEVVDLVDKDEVPTATPTTQEKPKNYVKMATFDCVICMDNVKDLTVTHCGHLFCSECLHSALNMDPSRRICPICRQKIDKVPAGGKFGQKGRGFYSLELKLVTKKVERSSDIAV
ncbi:hypothetical protein C8A01DRAFT_16117 [Parachaetomium inaequale]|uniref:RING-type domain-containing protein n=1 Tax=Parachaetomium inaequale TaxID=2588326 RepID=A0AAN6PH58_9PEZI|nr:hypothetical protein C8A01DRAFT_16117 [Parachaetomium inaequale]